jgi:hypothetical protein
MSQFHINKQQHISFAPRVTLAGGETMKRTRMSCRSQNFCALISRSLLSEVRRGGHKMAISATKCLKIETAGLVIGWTYFVASVIGLVVILGAAIYGMKVYIAGER